MGILTITGGHLKFSGKLLDLTFGLQMSYKSFLLEWELASTQVSAPMW